MEAANSEEEKKSRLLERETEALNRLKGRPEPSKADIESAREFWSLCADPKQHAKAAEMLLKKCTDAKDDAAAREVHPKVPEFLRNTLCALGTGLFGVAASGVDVVTFQAELLDLSVEYVKNQGIAYKAPALALAVLVDRVKILLRCFNAFLKLQSNLKKVRAAMAQQPLDNVDYDQSLMLALLFMEKHAAEMTEILALAAGALVRLSTTLEHSEKFRSAVEACVEAVQNVIELGKQENKVENKQQLQYQSFAESELKLVSEFAVLFNPQKPLLKHLEAEVSARVRSKTSEKAYVRNNVVPSLEVLGNVNGEKFFEEIREELLFWYRFFGPRVVSVPLDRFTDALAFHFRRHFNAEAVDPDLLKGIVAVVMDADQNRTIECQEMVYFARRFLGLRHCFAARYLCVPDFDMLSKTRESLDEKGHENQDIKNLREFKPSDALKKLAAPKDKQGLVHRTNWYSHLQREDAIAQLNDWRGVTDGMPIKNIAMRAEFPRFIFRDGRLGIDWAHAFSMSIPYFAAADGFDHVKLEIDVREGSAYYLFNRGATDEIRAASVQDALREAFKILDWRDELKLLDELLRAWDYADRLREVHRNHSHEGSKHTASEVLRFLLEDEAFKSLAQDWKGAFEKFSAETEKLWAELGEDEKRYETFTNGVREYLKQIDTSNNEQLPRAWKRVIANREADHVRELHLLLEMWTLDTQEEKQRESIAFAKRLKIMSDKNLAMMLRDPLLPVKATAFLLSGPSVKEAVSYACDHYDENPFKRGSSEAKLREVAKALRYVRGSAVEVESLREKLRKEVSEARSQDENAEKNSWHKIPPHGIQSLLRRCVEQHNVDGFEVLLELLVSDGKSSDPAVYLTDPIPQFQAVAMERHVSRAQSNADSTQPVPNRLLSMSVREEDGAMEHFGHLGELGLQADQRNILHWLAELTDAEVSVGVEIPLGTADASLMSDAQLLVTLAHERIVDRFMDLLTNEKHKELFSKLLDSRPLIETPQEKNQALALDPVMYAAMRQNHFLLLRFHEKMRGEQALWHRRDDLHRNIFHYLFGIQSKNFSEEKVERIKFTGLWRYIIRTIADEGSVSGPRIGDGLAPTRASSEEDEKKHEVPKTSPRPQGQQRVADSASQASPLRELLNDQDVTGVSPVLPLLALCRKRESLGETAKSRLKNEPRTPAELFALMVLEGMRLNSGTKVDAVKKAFVNSAVRSALKELFGSEQVWVTLKDPTRDPIQRHDLADMFSWSLFHKAVMQRDTALVEIMLEPGSPCPIFNNPKEPKKSVLYLLFEEGAYGEHKSNEQPAPGAADRASSKPAKASGEHKSSEQPAPGAADRTSSKPTQTASHDKSTRPARRIEDEKALVRLLVEYTPKPDAIKQATLRVQKAVTEAHKKDRRASQLHAQRTQAPEVLSVEAELFSPKLDQFEPLVPDWNDAFKVTMSPLELLILRGPRFHPEFASLVEVLLASGKFSQPEPETTRFNALHVAAFANRAAVIKRLVDVYRWDPSCLTREGFNALHIAAKWGSRDAVDILSASSRCANVDAKVERKGNNNTVEKSLEKRKSVARNPSISSAVSAKSGRGPVWTAMALAVTQWAKTNQGPAEGANSNLSVAVGAKSDQNDHVGDDGDGDVNASDYFQRQYPELGKLAGKDVRSSTSRRNDDYNAIINRLLKRKANKAHAQKAMQKLPPELRVKLWNHVMEMYDENYLNTDAAKPRNRVVPITSIRTAEDTPEMFEDQLTQLLIDQKFESTLLKRTRRWNLAIMLLSVVVTCIIMVQSTNRNSPSAFYVHDSIYQAIASQPFYAPPSSPSGPVNPVTYTFPEVSDLDELWLWLRGPVLDFFYPQTRAVYWSGAQKFNRSELLLSGQNVLLGVPRLRQVRSELKDCAVDWDLAQHSEPCFSAAGERVLFTESTEPFGNFASAGEFQSPEALRSWDSVNGRVASYSGGGFVYSFPSPRNVSARGEAEAALAALQNDSWIDAKTRAVFLEFAIFNANENWFVVAQFLAELPRVGGLVPSADLRVNRLRYIASASDVALAFFECLCLSLWFIFITWQWMRDFRMAKPGEDVFCCFCMTVSNQNRRAAVTLPEIFLFLLLLLWAGLRIACSVIEAQVEWTSQTELAQVGLLSQLLSAYIYVISAVIIVLWVLLVPYLIAFKLLRKLLVMMNLMLTDFLKVAVLLVFTIIAFLTAEYVAYGYSRAGTTTMMASFIDLVMGLVRGRDFSYEGAETNFRPMGTIYNLLFLVVINLLLLNLLIAILNDAYKRATEDAGEKFWSFWQFREILDTEDSASFTMIDKMIANKWICCRDSKEMPRERGAEMAPIVRQGLDH